MTAPYLILWLWVLVFGAIGAWFCAGTWLEQWQARREEHWGGGRERPWDWRIDGECTAQRHHVRVLGRKDGAA